MNQSSWICCQLGAREHYAVARALYSNRALAKLITDFWCPPGSIFSRMLASSLTRGLHGRYHSSLVESDVHALNFSALTFEAIARIRGQSGWQQIMTRNDWFQHKVVNWLTRNAETLRPEKPIVFAYSYAAREIFRVAKQRGWPTVLGQIDAGPVEEQIVAEEVAREPELAGSWKPVPRAYWDFWREECNLADRIVVNSEWSRTCLEKAGVNGSKLFVIPLAYEPITDIQITRSYPAHFTRDRPLRVLFLGQVNLRKGVGRLFKAIRLLEKEAIEFHFVGPIQVSIPEDLKNRPRVCWHSLVSRDHVAAFLLLENLTGETITDVLRQCLANPELLAQLAAGSGNFTGYSLHELGERFVKLAGNRRQEPAPGSRS